MSRYIDADELSKKVEVYFQNTSKVKVFKVLMETTPSIDIVRCKECKYCVDEGSQRALVCDNSYIDMDIHPDDFCSYGERSE